MNVSLNAQLEGYVKQKVATGRYNSVSEVVREALRLLEAQDVMKDLKIKALRAEINEGLESLDSGAGKALDVESIKQKARARQAGINT